MLALSRKAGETIVIDHRITVKVTKVRGGRVWFGVDAPKEVAVHRGEVEARLDERKES